MSHFQFPERSNTPILFAVSSLTSTMLPPVASVPTLMPSVDGNLYDHAVAVIGLTVVSITCTRLFPVSSTYSLPFRTAMSRGLAKWPAVREPRAADVGNVHFLVPSGLKALI